MTLPANWTAGSQFTASAENAVEAAVNTLTNARPIADTYANRPAAAAGNAGALYFCTDTDKVYRSDGTAWTLIRMGGLGGQFPLSDPSPGTGTTTLGTSTFTSDKGDRLLTSLPVSNDNWRVEYSTLTPTSNYSATAYLVTNIPLVNFSFSGLVLREGSSGKMIVFGPAYQNGLLLGAYKIASETSTITAYQTTAMTSQSMPRLFRIRDDGTNRYFEYSYDEGFNWITFNTSTILRTDYITPTQVGFGADNGATTSPVSLMLRLRSFKVG